MRPSLLTPRTLKILCAARAKGKTKKECAEGIGVSTGSISNWLRPNSAGTLEQRELRRLFVHSWRLAGYEADKMRLEKLERELRNSYLAKFSSAKAGKAA